MYRLVILSISVLVFNNERQFLDATLILGRR
jgi:hypothetical protein